MPSSLAQTWWLILLSVASGVAGQTAIKLGVTRPDAVAASSGVLAIVGLILRSPLVLLGLMLYGIGALAWIAVLARLPLNYAYPFLALNFVLITVVSRLVLGEPVPVSRWIGIGVICVGILLVSRTGR